MTRSPARRPPEMTRSPARRPPEMIPRLSCPGVAMLREQMEEYVEVSREIVKVMISDNAAAPLKKSLDRQEAIITSLIDTELQASDLIREILSIEEKVAETFLETEETKQSATSKLHHIERELQDVSESNAAIETNIKFLQKEVEDLKVLEDEVTEVEREAQEDTTVVIPSALYLAKLFHSVTKIDWDYSCDSALIKGIHYGGTIAQPICIDSTQHSKMFTCDYLWSLLSTEW